MRTDCALVFGTTKQAPPCDLILLHVALALEALPKPMATKRTYFLPFTVTAEFADLKPHSAPNFTAYLFQAACALAAEEKAPS